jgi:hypothetical protein
MTLSHCWEDYVPLKLLTSNIEAFKDCIETTTLRKPFKGTLQIAPKLGIRYIWIDSLRIIQDSHQDWTEQAAIMGDIYQNSWCNIAASAAWTVVAAASWKDYLWT